MQYTNSYVFEDAKIEIYKVFCLLPNYDKEIIIKLFGNDLDKNCNIMNVNDKEREYFIFKIISIIREKLLNNNNGKKLVKQL